MPKYYYLGLLSLVAMYGVRHWHRFKPQEMAGLLWALALLKACPLDTWRLLLEKLSQSAPSCFDNADLYQLYQTYLLLESSTDACKCPSCSALAPLLLECSTDANQFPHAHGYT